MKGKLKPARRNPVAKAVRTPAFAMQVVKSDKQYTRKQNKGVWDEFFEGPRSAWSDWK